MLLCRVYFCLPLPLHCWGEVFLKQHWMLPEPAAGFCPDSPLGASCSDWLPPASMAPSLQGVCCWHN